jgi:hypothetical protein
MNICKTSAVRFAVTDVHEVITGRFPANNDEVSRMWTLENHSEFYGDRCETSRSGGICPSSKESSTSFVSFFRRPKWFANSMYIRCNTHPGRRQADRLGMTTSSAIVRREIDRGHAAHIDNTCRAMQMLASEVEVIVVEAAK